MSKKEEFFERFVHNGSTGDEFKLLDSSAHPEKVWQWIEKELRQARIAAVRQTKDDSNINTIQEDLLKFLAPQMMLNELYKEQRRLGSDRAFFEEYVKVGSRIEEIQQKMYVLAGI